MAAADIALAATAVATVTTMNVAAMVLNTVGSVANRICLGVPVSAHSDGGGGGGDGGCGSRDDDSTGGGSDGSSSGGWSWGGGLVQASNRRL